MKQNLNFYMMIQNLDFVLKSNTKMNISINNINTEIIKIQTKIMDKFNQSQEIDVKNKGLIEKILDIIKNKFTNVDDSINNINEKIAEIKSKSASLSKIENIEIENMDVSPIDSINKGSSLSSVDPSQIHYIKPSFNSSQIPLPDSPESSINYINPGFNISQIPLPDSPIESKQKLNQLKISPPLFIPKKPLILKF